MKNLLTETKTLLENNGHTLDDVVWVGCASFSIDIEEFKRLANNKYDAGFGSPKVANDLLVVGSDWWLERHEYDGSELWEYKSLPTKPEAEKTVDKLIGPGWLDLRGCVSREEDEE